MNHEKIKTWLKNNKLLILVVAIGFLLRISLLFWGIPITPYIHCDDFRSACYHADESDGLYPLTVFPENYFSSDRYLGYGTTMQNFIGFPLLAVKFILSQVFLPGRFYEIYGILVWIIARFYTVVLGTATIVLSYLLALSLFKNKLTALISAALTAVATQHVLDSAVLTVTVPESFFLLLNFLMSHWVVRKNDVSSYVLLGITSALLLGTKLTGGLFLVIPFLLAIGTKKFRWKYMAAYALTTCIVFLVFHPYILNDSLGYVDFYLERKIDDWDRLAAPYLDTAKNWIRMTNRAAGYPLAAAFVIGFLLMGKDRLLYKLLPLLFLLMYYLFWQAAFKLNFAATVIPLLTIYAANGFGGLIDRNFKLARYGGTAMLVSFLLLALRSDLLSIYVRFNDPRTSATRYIMGSISEGATLGFSEVSTEYSWEEHSWRYPKIDLARFNTVNFLERPDILIVSSFDLREVVPALHSEKLKPGNIWDEKFRKDWYKYIPPSPEVFEFYKQLISSKGDYVLLKSFRNILNDSSLPDQYPEIYVYQKAP